MVLFLGFGFEIIFAIQKKKEKRKENSSS